MPSSESASAEGWRAQTAVLPIWAQVVGVLAIGPFADKFLFF
jgi:hypothetical protein